MTTPSTPTALAPPRPARPSRLASHPVPDVPPRQTRIPRPAPGNTAAHQFHTRLAAALPPPPSPSLESGFDEASDCESDCSDEESSTTRGGRRFSGVRTSIIRPPRDIEEAAASANSSSSTLAGTPRLDANEFKSPRPHAALDLFESHGLDPAPLPPKKGSRLYRYLRWNFGSVYRRIFSLVYLANMAAMAVMIARRAMSGGRVQFTHEQASIAVTANILAAMLVRNEHVVNAMFWVFGTWTRNLPLRIRTLAAKVYSYGGIHSGGAVAATFWYTAFLVLLTVDFQRAGPLTVVRGYIYFVSYFILFLLVSMVVSAHPRLRRTMHNWFEGIHRFMGWLAVLLFWAQVLLLAADATRPSGSPSASLGRALLVSPNFWMLIAITLLVIYPWTRLRLRDVEAEVLSDHCLKLTFRHRNVHYGQAIRLTDAPLKETHAFGVIPLPPPPPPPSAPSSPASHCPGCTCATTTPEKELQQPAAADLTLAAIRAQTLTAAARATPRRTSPLAAQPPKGFSVLVSKAGDWTAAQIRNPPRRLYTRGAPQFGVLRVAGLFAPCVLVATGSGIAPCLSLLVHLVHGRAEAPAPAPAPVRVVWATKDPVRTYGREVVELVYRADPGAVIVDTSSAKGGRGNARPDLVRLAYRVWEDGREVVPGEGRRRAEAVVVISNQKVTQKVVYGLESRGVAAYGAIFDS